MSKQQSLKKAFVIGHPIDHSRSPLIHNFWIRQHGLDAVYEALEVTPANLPKFVARLKGGEFVGGNVTLPHKQSIMNYCSTTSSSAQAIGAVNTLRIAQGEIVGSNSDHFGFVDNLDQQAPGWAHSLKTAIVLGAGGAARAVVFALLRRGVEQIVVLNRTVAKAQNLAASFGERVSAGTLNEFAAHAAEAGLLVNTSAVGLNGTRFEGLELDALPKSALVNDIVYTPLQTPLLKQAQKRGLPTVDGLGMLLHQAIPGFEMWFGVRPEVTPELRQMIEQTIVPSGAGR